MLKEQNGKPNKSIYVEMKLLIEATYLVNLDTKLYSKDHKTNDLALIAQMDAKKLSKEEIPIDFFLKEFCDECEIAVVPTRVVAVSNTAH